MISYKPFLKQLIDKNIKKKDIIKATGITGATLARLNTSKYVSLEVIDKLCNYLDCSICDVVEHIKDVEADD